MLDEVPAVCVGSVAAVPLALPAMMKPAVLKVDEHVLAPLQLLPFGQQ